MKKNRIRKDNRGDSLILVIGCITLLSLLGVVILAKTMDNQTMKLAEEQAQAVFFEADNASAELAVVLESITQDVVKDAFSDMMVEYSKHASEADRKERFRQYFEAALDKRLQRVDGTELQAKLQAALVPGGAISGLTITYSSVDSTEITDPVQKSKVTDVIRVEDVTISYEQNNVNTTITTDICIQAKIPNVDESRVSSDFSDFAIIADEATKCTTNEALEVNGNLYTGSDLTASIGSKILINDADKVLVRGTMEMDGASAEITVTSSEELEEGNGIWANGIYVKKGKLTTNNVNLYVADDLTIEDNGANIDLNGASAEYFGYSGGNSLLPNYQRSSAITINKVKDMTLDLSGLAGGVYIKGASYIFDEAKWTGGSEGVLQGESVAYKDMQAMYLVPGDCMAAGHNPVMTATESAEVTGYQHVYKDGDETKTFDFENYLDPAQKTVTRISMLDGTTQTTYVYLNFKSEAAAAEYVRAYLATTEGDAIRYQGTNMGVGSKIQYPATVCTSANALQYDGSTVNWIPAANSVKQIELMTKQSVAKERYKGLFSKLKMYGGSAVSPTYGMVKEGILKADAFNAIPANTALTPVPTVPDLLTAGLEYKLIMYNGNLTIEDDSPYKEVNGILVVNGDLTYSATSAKVNGLVLATGNVTVTEGVMLTANKTAVETLLANPEVVKYFRGFAGSTEVYASSEAVDISFENWKRN